MLMSRLYFREIAGRKVFYPFGRIGAGYLVNSPLQRKIRRFMRIWMLCVAAVAAAQIAGHVTSDVEEELLAAFFGAYLVLATVYATRMAFYVRKLKITPLQFDAR